MNLSRRQFSRAAMLAPAALLTAESFAGNRKAFKLPLAAKIFQERLGVRYPIAQAVFGGSTPELAAAVANAGGLGGMGLTWSPEVEVREYVTRTRALTKAPFAVGYVLSFGANTLTVALEAGAPVIQFSFGIPNSDQVAAIRRRGAKFGVQISNPHGAKLALATGADYLSCQGQEAGGHVQAQGSWRENLSAVLEVAAGTPVLVAGGLGNGHDLRNALSLGAAGGVFGTRFVASREYPAHAHYKERLTKAKARETVLTTCFDGGWPSTLHRVLRNPTVDRWEAAGVPLEGSRPGEGDIVSHIGALNFERYSIFPPFEATTGAIEDMALYAGIGVDRINDVPGAAELVARLWQECEHA